MEQDQYVKVNIKESVRSQLKEQAKSAGKTLADYIEWLAGRELDAKDKDSIADEADALLEKLDYQNEHPESMLSPEDQELLASLGPEELPACCQEIFDDPENPVPTCKHWRQAYENYYGQMVWGYVNDLVGGGYRTWFKKYVK